MARRRTPQTVLFCSCLALGLTIATAGDQQTTNINYDGRWWLSISPSEQSGFLNGYLDCYLYECKGRARFSFPVDIYQVHITKFFREKGSDLDEPVSQVLVGFRDPPGFKIVDKYAQPVKGRHGFYDGTYWKQISALGGKAEQLGFVEGYLWCHAHESGNKGGTFSKAPAEYVALITRWYGFVPDTGDVNAERESTPIAEALLRFRDHPEGPKPGSK